jgi:hypothetical protein
MLSMLNHKVSEWAVAICVRSEASMPTYLSSTAPIQTVETAVMMKHVLSPVVRDRSERMATGIAPLFDLETQPRRAGIATDVSPLRR